MLIKKMFIFLFMFSISYILPPSAVIEGASQIAIVKVEILNVRKGPSLTQPVVMQIKKGEEFNILSQKKEWVELKLNENETGWVASWLIDLKNTTVLQQVTSTVDSLRVRSGPGTSFQILGSLYKGDSYNILDENDAWTKIQYNNEAGWVSSQYVSKTEVKKRTTSQKPQSTQENSKQPAIVQASILNVRNKPTTDSEVIGKLKKGETITFTSIQDGWYKINFEDSFGWIASDYVTKQDKAEQHTNQPKDPNKNKQAKVIASILNVRKEPSLEGKIVTKVKSGDLVKVIEENKEWSKIQIDNQSGWVANNYLDSNAEQQQVSNPPKVMILHNGTNIRSGPSTTYDVVIRANEGDHFPIVNQKGDWFEIELPDNKTAFIAGWIVSTDGSFPKVERPGIEAYFKGKTIVIDPGHGGRDPGTSGTSGTKEKALTMSTAKLLADKLKAAGADVILTRNNDHYISLQYRVSTSHYYRADAFLSLHFDSTPVASVNGISSFYFNRRDDLPLATAIHQELLKRTGLSDRKVKYGNYHVLRENKQPSVLLELGFLSNKREEYIVKTKDYQEKAAQAIFYGLAQYFK